MMETLSSVVGLLKMAGVTIVVVAILEVYDLFVCRPHPCSGCRWWAPDCAAVCGRLARWRQLRDRQERFRTAWRRWRIRARGAR